MYINDLISIVDKRLSNILLYADDTILFSAADDIVTALRHNQLVVDKVCNWCFFNRLSINIKKTKHLSIMSKRDETVNVQTMYVSIDKIRVENVHTYNYLGVIVDDKLTFTEFRDNKYNKVNMRLYHLKHLRPNINNDIANRIYKQTILPLMDYSDFMIESSSLPQI